MLQSSSPPVRWFCTNKKLLQMPYNLVSVISGHERTSQTKLFCCDFPRDSSFLLGWDDFTVQTVLLHFHLILVFPSLAFSDVRCRNQSEEQNQAGEWTWSYFFKQLPILETLLPAAVSVTRHGWLVRATFRRISHLAMCDCQWITPFILSDEQ